MPKKGQTLPYKVVHTTTEGGTRTSAFADEYAAHRNAALIGRHGGNARVVLRVPGEDDQPLGTYGPNVTHDIAEDRHDGSWTCTCGASAAAARDQYGGSTLDDHLYHLGYSPVVWSLMEAPAPEAPGQEPGPLDIDVPGYILDWGRNHGMGLDRDDLYLLVTPADEYDPIGGEVSTRSGLLPEDQVEKLRDKIAESEMAHLPEWMRG